jgi:hypothetical protein
MLVFVDVWFMTEKKKFLFKSFGRPLEYQNISCFGTPKSGVPKHEINSLFPQCRWGCLYNKVLSLFSKTSFNSLSAMDGRDRPLKN